MSFIGPAALALTALVCYFCLRWQQRFWHGRDVNAVPQRFFLFMGRQHLAYSMQQFYHRYKQPPQSTHSAPFVRLNMLITSAVLVHDLELLKRIFISDFEAFPDRGFYYNAADDPLSASIVRLEIEPWRRLRAKLTPTFSSGKLKLMCPMVAVVGARLAVVVQQLLDGSVLDAACSGQQLNVRDLCARYNTDVIGSVAFGIECDSLQQPRTEFRVMGDKVFDCFNPLIEALGDKYAQLLRRLRVKVFTDELNAFYSRIVRENIAYRAAYGVRRNDFLDLLIDLQRTSTLTEEEVVAQSFIFFIGGFETSSTTMTYCLWELARNPEVQQRAREDVLEALAKHDLQEFNYECLKDMQYLEMVIMETLRKYPVTPTLQRFARKDYVVPGTTQVIPAGTQVLIPIYAIQNDPAYYDAPEEFRPERFETGQYDPMTFLPFGAGPRGCIAKRLGKIQTLIGMAALLRQFKFSCGPRTPTTLEFDSNNLRLFSLKEGQLWLKVEKAQPSDN